MAKPRTQVATPEELRARLLSAKAPGATKPVLEQARRALIAWLDTAARHGMPFDDTVRKLASGEAAVSIGAALEGAIAADPPEAMREAACRSGCAFCCILSGGEGGTITRAEAARVHAALAPFAGRPDGRGWHASACPALDPGTRTCRIYEARPTICRSFLSRDASACEENAAGGEAAGAGILGSHVVYLAALALCRSALAGTVRVKSYALDRIAAGAVAGEDLAKTLAAAEQKPRALDDGLRSAGRTIAGARR